MAALIKNPLRLKNRTLAPLFAGEACADFLQGFPSKGLENPALALFAASLSFGQKIACPACGGEGLSFKKNGGAARLGAKKNAGPGKIVFRTPAHTFRKCPECGMLYLSFSADSRVQYESDYFGSEYKKQYGKTYLEDFEAIKAQGRRRAKIIRRALPHSHFLEGGTPPRLLDIGCAYGPFLSAAYEEGFVPYGTDISKSALAYVKDSLGFECVLSSFADFDAKKVFAFEKFDAVSMWYVIEHCQNLKELLLRVNSLLKKGGVFSFSTPNASGASARFNTDAFFKSSPKDHYTIWDARKAKKILKAFGFKAYKIVQTGIHPERIKMFKKNSQKPFIFAVLSVFCKALALGDTFEIYCQKIKDAR